MSRAVVIETTRDKKPNLYLHGSCEVIRRRDAVQEGARVFSRSLVLLIVVFISRLEVVDWREVHRCRGESKRGESHCGYVISSN